MTEQERQEYGLKTLKQLHDELAALGQFEKYPAELSWIKWELEKYQSLDEMVCKSRRSAVDKYLLQRKIK